MRRLWFGALALSLAACISGCNREPVCRGEDSCVIDCGDDCEPVCEQFGAECDASCGDRCDYVCEDGPNCKVACGADCDIQCGSVSTCNATCGERCLYTCEDANNCAPQVGDESRVECSRVGNCNPVCEGTCVVDCQNTGPCNVTCMVDGMAPIECADGTVACGECLLPEPVSTE